MLPQVPEPAPHPSVARAAVGPAAVVPAAGGVAIGLAAGSDMVAVLLGVGAWLAGMAVVLGRAARRRRRTRPAEIDPWALPDPWRQYVRQALSARQRFHLAVEGWGEGPVRDRLLGLQPRLGQAIDEVWTVARRGAALAGSPAGGARAAATRKELGAELEKVQAERLRLNPAATDRAEVLAGREAAIASQIRAARRAEDAADEAADRLRTMTAQLDEAVTRLLEAGLHDHDDAGAGAVDTLAPSIDAFVEQIRALEEGLRSVERWSDGLALAGGPDRASPGGPALGGGSETADPPSPPSAPPAS